MAQRKTTKKEETPVVSANMRGIALAAMIVGIVGAVFCWVPFWGFIIAATALALGIVGLVRRAPNRGMALAGTILGGFGIVINIVFIVFFAAVALYSSSDTYSQPVHTVPAYYNY